MSKLTERQRESLDIINGVLCGNGARPLTEEDIFSAQPLQPLREDPLYEDYLADMEVE